MDLLAVVLITLRTFSAITLVKIVALNRSALTPVVLQKTQTNVNVERIRTNLCVVMVNIVKSLVTLQPVHVMLIMNVQHVPQLLEVPAQTALMPIHA